MPRAGISESTERRAKEVASLYVAGFGPEVIAEKLREKDPEGRFPSLSTVLRDLRIAREQGWIQVEESRRLVVQEDRPALAASLKPRDVGRVSAALVRAFKLRDTLVVPGENESQGDIDELARRLGEAGAGYLNGILLPGARVGIGTGQSAHEVAVAYLQRMMSVRGSTGTQRLVAQATDDEDVYRVSSLAGGLGIYPREHSASLMFADGSAVLLSEALRPSEVHLTRQGYSSEVQYKLPFPLHIGIIGVGNVAAGDRSCFRQAEFEMAPDERRHASAIIDDVERVQACVQSASGIPGWQRLYWPVADVLGRPILVPPPREIESLIDAADRDLLTRLDKNVNWIARRVHAASFDELRSVKTCRSCLIIAGGAHKAFAIHRVLTTLLDSERSGAFRHALVTDLQTAEELLAIQEGMADHA